MVYAPDSGRSQSSFARSLPFEISDGEADGLPHHTLKKLLLISTLGLSGVAAYVGLLELTEAGMGELTLEHKVIAAFWVLLLMAATVWLAGRMAATVNPLARLVCIPGALLLGIISAGLGFGFYWRMLDDGTGEARLHEPAAAVQASLKSASARFDELASVLSGIATATQGNTACVRESAAVFAFAAAFVDARARVVSLNAAALESSIAAARASGRTADTVKALDNRLATTVASFNALRAEPQFRKLRQDLALQTEPTPAAGPQRRAACPEARLTHDLHTALHAIDGLPPLARPAIADAEGSGTAAFRRLAATLDGLLANALPASGNGVGTLQHAMPTTANTKQTDASPGLSERDYPPLAIAILVNLGLILAAGSRPRPGRGDAWGPREAVTAHRAVLREPRRYAHAVEPFVEPAFPRQPPHATAADPPTRGRRPGTPPPPAPRHRYPGTDAARASDVFGPYAESAEAELNTDVEDADGSRTRARTEPATRVGAHHGSPGESPTDAGKNHKKIIPPPLADRPSRSVAAPEERTHGQNAEPKDEKSTARVSPRTSQNFSDDGAAEMASRLRPLRRSA